MVGLQKLAVALEGEYTTWALVWSKDYGAGVDMIEIIVDNEGTVHAEDIADEIVYVRTYGGTETTIADYGFYLWQRISSVSLTGKYFVGVPHTPYREFQVWKDGVRIFIRDVQLDESEARTIIGFSMSPNGKYVAITVTEYTTINNSIMMLYEGS